MKSAVMCAERNLCALAFVLLVIVETHLSSGKPFTPQMACDFWCEDYDDRIPGASTTMEDLLDNYFDPCRDCPTRRPPPFRRFRQPVNFVIPPSANGQNVTIVNNRDGWFMQFRPQAQSTQGQTTQGQATPSPMPFMPIMPIMSAQASASISPPTTTTAAG